MKSHEAPQEKRGEKSWPVLGCGVGLRKEHYSFVLENRPPMDWFEVVSENFMNSGGRPLHILQKIREHYPVVLHGTSLSVASCDPFHPDYLSSLKTLADLIEPALVSDHLCWCGVDGQVLHDLLPLPYTEEALDWVVSRIGQVQDFLGRRFLLENVSTYVTYQHSVIPEWEFLAEVARRSGCGILLDLNNIYVNAFNHQFDALRYLEAIPAEAVGYFHLAGHTDKGEFLFDTHTGHIITPVWELYREALRRYGQVATLIEWDADLPEFSALADEAAKARAFYQQAAKRDAKITVTHSFSEENKIAAPHNLLLQTERWIKSRVQPLEQKHSFDEIVLNKQRTTPGEIRMEVYADGYFARIHDALVETFPAVCHVTGEAVFQDLAERYAHTFPSEHYNLSFAGKYFVSFLESQSIKESLPFLPDLARLEWQVSRSFHAYDLPAIDVAALQAVSSEDWENMVFTFQESVGIIASNWPVLDVWCARKIPLKEINIHLVDRPQNVFVYRKGTDVYCENLQLTQYQLLQALLQGKSLGAALEEIISEETAELPPVFEWFRQWAALGLLVRLSLPLAAPSHD